MIFLENPPKNNYTRPLLFGIGFLINAIILMRMIRHDENIQRKSELKVINTLSMIGMVFMVIFLSSGVFLNLIQNIIHIIWTQILGRIFIMVTDLFARVLYFLFSLLGYGEWFSHVYESRDASARLRK